MTTPTRAGAPPASSPPKAEDRPSAIELARRYPVRGGSVAPQKVPWLGRPGMKSTALPK